MMSCERTEKVSLLVDGELAPEEARAVESHVETCADCRAAREDFLLLRRQINSYVTQTDSAAQRRALEAILSSKPAAHANGSERPAHANGRRVRFAAAFTLARFATASPLTRFAALAMLALVVFAAGLLLYTNSRRSAQSVSKNPSAASPVETATAMPRDNALTPNETAKENDEEKRQTETESRQKNDEKKNQNEERPGENLTRQRDSLVAAVDARRNRSFAGSRRRREERENTSQTVAVARKETTPRGAQPTQALNTQPVAAGGNELGVEAAMSRVAALDAGRHVEQAQMLLRSFRNARLSDDDLAYEKKRSKKLLYRNIVIRREAASKGDTVVAGLLDRLEPILIDIANLPARPDAEEVNSIRERVRRKNIVVSLQAAAASLPKDF